MFSAIVEAPIAARSETGGWPTGELKPRDVAKPGRRRRAADRHNVGRQAVRCCLRAHGV